MNSYFKKIKISNDQDICCQSRFCYFSYNQNYNFDYKFVLTYKSHKKGDRIMISNYVKSDILPCLKVKGFDVYVF